MDRSRKAKKKEVKYKSYLDFLNTCLRQELIPKGFKINFNLNLSADSQTKLQCDKIKTDASLRLMQVAANVCRDRLNELSQGEENYLTDASVIDLQGEVCRGKRVKENK